MRQAMIFAAGMGTRLKPITDTMPKALVKVGGEPLLTHVMSLLQAAEIDRVVVNVHHFSNQIIDFLSNYPNSGMDIRVSDETECLLDTGGALKKAECLFDCHYPILIHNVDILSNVDLDKFYNIHSEDAAVLLVSNRVTKRYLLFDDDMLLVGWTNIETGEVRSPYPDLEVSKCHKYAFAGIHRFSPQLFGMMDSFPDKFGIIDFYLNVCSKANIRGYFKSDLCLMDVGKIDTLSEAENFLKQL